MKKIILILLLSVTLQPLIAANDGVKDRAYWCETLYKVSFPVLDALSKQQLKEQMPIEVKGNNQKSRADYAYLEALGRTMCGLAPWLELPEDNTKEGKMRKELLELSHKAIRNAVDPTSKDYMNFVKPSQPLVDAAFLAQAFIRSPKNLWGGLDQETQKMVIDAFKSTRTIQPFYNNWLLFSASIEAFFLAVGEQWDPMRTDYAIKKHLDWYKGDGAYGDGPNFHWDYYNSFVIQPMLVDILEVMIKKKKVSEKTYQMVISRASRFAEVQERMISPEGTFPPIGRSITYRFGCLQGLAQMALMHKLPKDITPAQVRGAMTASAKRFFENSKTFDKQGWLRLGFVGHQPKLAESYICTGSLYLTTAGFLPLGLPAADPFWSDPKAPWTSVKAWGGMDTPIDGAIYN